MTIQNTGLRKAGPYQGNGVNATFPFAFKVFSSADILATYLNSSDVEIVLTLSGDYSVTLNPDQNTAPGGTVNMNWVPVSGTSITLTSNVVNTQNLVLTQAGGFYPSAINDALDRIVIQIQQLAEQLSRTFKIAVSSIGTPGSYIGDYLTQAAASATASANSATSASGSATASAYSAASAASSAASMNAVLLAATTSATATATASALSATNSATAAANSALAATTPTAAVMARFIDTSPFFITPVSLSSIYTIGGWDMGSIVPAPSPFPNETTVRRVNMAADNISSFDFGTVP